MSPKVSVIVPVYGVEAYIGKCAESLFAQTYPAIEFIFVNDGTPDRSMDVLRELIDRSYPQLKERIILIDKPNGGLPQARLTGLRRASGDYVLHVDSDDWIEPDAVERLVEAADGADFVYFFGWKEYASGRKHLFTDPPYDDPKALARDLVRFKVHGFLCTKFVKRSCYRESLFYPRYNMHEDVVLTCQLAYNAEQVRLLPVPLYHYRRDNPSAASRVRKGSRRLQSARNFLDLYEFYRDSLAGSPVEEVAGDILVRSAWIGWRFDRGLFRERPYLAREAKSVPLRGRTLLRQLILRISNL